jgi:hypothetical protein
MCAQKLQLHFRRRGTTTGQIVVRALYLRTYVDLHILLFMLTVLLLSVTVRNYTLPKLRQSILIDYKLVVSRWPTQRWGALWNEDSDKKRDMEFPATPNQSICTQAPLRKATAKIGINILHKYLASIYEAEYGVCPTISPNETNLGRYASLVVTLAVGFLTVQLASSRLCRSRLLLVRACDRGQIGAFPCLVPATFQPNT